MRGYFVTGTGTEVGKTAVAAAIAHSARREGAQVAVFKPAVSGLVEYPLTAESWEGAPELADHALLRLASGSEQRDDEIAPYRYGPPVSPHLGAELAGERIEPDRLRDAALAATQDADVLICEGVGGFLVPLTPEYFVRDLALDLSLPVVIVAPPGLGTINHTLLTIESVRGSGLEISAVVLNRWPAEPTVLERSNLETIEGLGGVPVMTLPELDLRRPESWPALAPKLSERRLEAA